MYISIKLNTLTAEISPTVWEHSDNEEIRVTLLPTSLAKNRVCLIWNREVYEFRDNTVTIPISAFKEVNQIEVRDILNGGAILRRWRCNPLTVLKEVVGGKSEIVWREERELYNQKILPFLDDTKKLKNVVSQQQETIKGLLTAINGLKVNNGKLAERVKALEGIDLFSEET